ncbi:orotate phosphoribosyltransferase [Bifidobacterium gallicum]|nr:orotate phosphoribosyltransferase [Bifidobacterium gallicum]KFI59018.1 orotate phosphoribosyltransferase [Bifidobacterium gallicum DSM 20093 = LMG 11596]
MTEDKQFRKTQVEPVSDASADAPAAATLPTPEGFAMMDPRDQLKTLLVTLLQGKAFSELYPVTLDHRATAVIGHLLIDTLEEQGFGVDDFDAVGALTPAAMPLVCAMMQAAASRGEDLDGFIMDFVFPSVKGPSIAGKRVLMLDAWLSEKSYIQTSSLVTLRNGNELSLDFGIIEAQGAQVVAVAALVGGVDMTSPTIAVINPVNDERHELPFIEVFHESELRDGVTED